MFWLSYESFSIFLWKKCHFQLKQLWTKRDCSHSVKFHFIKLSWILIKLGISSYLYDVLFPEMPWSFTAQKAVPGIEYIVFQIGVGWGGEGVNFPHFGGGGRGDYKFYWGEFSYRVKETWGVIWQFEPFSKLKTAFC